VVQNLLLPALLIAATVQRSLCGCVRQQGSSSALLTHAQMEECAEKLIKAGVLYADDTPVEKMREVGACRPRE